MHFTPLNNKDAFQDLGVFLCSHWMHSGMSWTRTATPGRACAPCTRLTRVWVQPKAVCCMSSPLSPSFPLSLLYLKYRQNPQTYLLKKSIKCRGCTSHVLRAQCDILLCPTNSPNPKILILLMVIRIFLSPVCSWWEILMPGQVVNLQGGYQDRAADTQHTHTNSTFLCQSHIYSSRAEQSVLLLDNTSCNCGARSAE